VSDEEDFWLPSSRRPPPTALFFVRKFL